MTECEKRTCTSEATKVWHGKHVCSAHYKEPPGECGDSDCHKEATTEWEGLEVCYFHYKKYRDDLDRVRSIGD